MFSRYQRGSVRQIGKARTWYGVYREDVKTPAGQIERKQRKVRLGAVSELPTKNAARTKLSEILQNSVATNGITFQELESRWQKAEGPTLKPSTLKHYSNALKAYALPVFGKQTITNINREHVQQFLAKQAETYSKSSLRSMRVVLSLTLGWAKNCGWIPANPCERVRLPRSTGGRTVKRSVLRPEQVLALVSRLQEPYATLVLFLATSGLRIGEALAVKPSDFEDGTFHIARRIYDGQVDDVKSKKSARTLPIDPELMVRIRALGSGDWVFRSREGTPLNPGNALKRYIRPAAKALEIELGGWHDFRHTLNTTLRRNGTHPRVISDILGHEGVSLAMNTYDHTDETDFKAPLSLVAENLLPNVTKCTATA